MKIAVIGAGAFGTALAVTLARDGRSVMLWARDAALALEMQESRQNSRRLPGITLPDSVSVTAETAGFALADVVLLVVPMQQLSSFLRDHAALLDGKMLVGCAKGIDLATGSGSAAILQGACPWALVAVLTGPSFAADIAAGLPTALTLACRDEVAGAELQAALSTPALRLYQSADVTGAELGGALKNVIAIAAGIVIGAGLGDSARAALMTRGFAEMTRLGTALGAERETMLGLSGFGDLILTCTSTQSRNFRYGQALGKAETPPAGTTVEGAATALAVAAIARRRGIDMPIATMVAALIETRITVSQAVESLMTRPLKKE